MASVTISTVFSDNGIIKKAQEAANKTKEAVQKEKDVNEYNTRYSKGHIIPIDTAIDDIETLELSEKDIDDYSFYDCLTFLTNNAISEVRKENNIKLENTLLENLYMTKLLLETKSENRSKKSKIKKLI